MKFYDNWMHTWQDCSWNVSYYFIVRLVLLLLLITNRLLLETTLLSPTHPFFCSRRVLPYGWSKNAGTGVVSFFGREQINTTFSRGEQIIINSEVEVCDSQHRRTTSTTTYQTMMEVTRKKECLA